jgi:hypothetical protein
VSDLADALFSGQLTGHLISGEELDSSLLANTAIKAELASQLAIDDGPLGSTEKSILQAKVAQSVVADGDYNSGDLLNDQLQAHLDAQLVDPFI